MNNKKKEKQQNRKKGFEKSVKNSKQNKIKRKILKKSKELCVDERGKLRTATKYLCYYLLSIAYTVCKCVIYH